MSARCRRIFPTLLTWLAVVLILKVTGTVVLGYANYFPPDFRADFLRGRQGYFWDGYHVPFYAHIAFGPISLVLGTLLLSTHFRRRFPQWHRRLGRVQVAIVLLLVVPSGFSMAYFAAAGPRAAEAFAMLALATGICVACGWRAAVQRRFAAHERWMFRGYLLLCSAVTLRLGVGLMIVLEFHAEGLDVWLAWTSWLVPLAIYEILLWMESIRRNPRPARA